jgi:hypothetical protein
MHLYSLKNYREAIEGFGRAGRSAKGLRPSAVNKNLLAQWAQRANLKDLTANYIFFNLCG